MVDEKDYNMALHFSSKLTVTLDPQAKAKGFVSLQTSSKNKKQVLFYSINYVIMMMLHNSNIKGM